jgi:hypothetical protein
MSYNEPPPSYLHGPPQQPPGYYGASNGPGPGMPMGPRDHPSAIAALGLGLASVFCLGALLGVPAILVGRKVIQAVANEPRRWKGHGTAGVGIVLGWISVFETAFVFAMTVSHWWVIALGGIALAIVGLTLLGLGTIKGLPHPLAAISTTLMRAPLAIGLTLTGIVAGSGIGLLATAGAAQQAAQRCTQAHTQYTSSSKGEDFAATRTAISGIEQQCSPDAADLTKMRRDLEAKEVAMKVRLAEEERVRLVKLAAEREKNAVDTFPEQSTQIGAAIAAVQAKVRQGKYEAASADLDDAQRRLDGFRGTTIDQSKAFTSLAQQIADKQKAIRPQLDRILEARRKAEAAADQKRQQAEAAAADKQRKEDAIAAVRAEIRGPKPTNSPWDGSVREVESYLKSALNDPSSYDHVESSVPVGEGDYWTVISSFRGKNAFGGLVLNTKKFYIQGGRVVKTGGVSD